MNVAQQIPPAGTQAATVSTAAPRPVTSHSKRYGILAVLGAVAIWGPSYVATKVAMAEMRPFLLAFVRFALASALFVPLAVRVWRARPTTERLPLGRLAAMGLTGGTLYFALQNAGLLYVTALEASLIGAVLPAITALASWLVMGERLRPAQIAGIGLAVAGVAFVALAGSGSRAATFSPLGYLLLVGSAVSWAAFGIIGRDLSARWPATILSAFNVGFGALFLLPLALADLVAAGWPTVSPLAWAMILFLGLGGSGVTFLLWNYALKTLSPGEATALCNLVPFVGAFSAWLVLKEPLTWVHLWGGLTVLGGVMLVSRQKSE